MANVHRLVLSLLASISAFLASDGLGQTLEWPWLGVIISDVSSSEAESFGSSETGSLVVSLEYAGPALAAGLRRMDIIVAVDGRPAANTRELTCLIQGRRPNDEVILTIVRAGKSRLVSAKLGSWPVSQDFPRPPLSDCGRDKLSQWLPVRPSLPRVIQPSA